ncbi:hypothetical protein TrVFT333_007092 [Trichoderma virens FT-333]|nr:hypothetical protein TrVFT333_007092 [Trichoderma virens FT-333]
MSSQSPLNPTFKGHVATTWDALLLFEACLQGLINHVPRRPHDRERQELISSGNIFIYEEHASAVPPGEKKRALKRKRGSQGVNKANSRSNSSAIDPNTISRDPERSLVGSLVDSYLFKERGLVKKTISITFQGVPHHLVSYYSIEDVDNKALITPSESPFFQQVKPRSELVMSQNFRNPVDEIAMYTQDENGFMAANQQTFYGLGAHVAEYSPHSHVADYGSQVMITQAMPVSAMAVPAHISAYAQPRLDFEFLQQTHGPQARDHFEAQVEAQVEAHAQVRLPHRQHFQFHDHLQHDQLQHDQLQQQQLQHQLHQQQQQQQLQRQQMQMQLQMHQQQYHHQLQQQHPDEQQQNQLPQPSPQHHEAQQDEHQQQQNGEPYGWTYGPNGYYYAAQEQ